MSKQAVLSFIAKAESDPNIQQKLKHVAGDVPAMLAIAADAGCGFTREEWTDTVADLARQGSGELEPDDLDRVTGGTGVQVTPTTKPNLAPLESFIKPRSIWL